VKETVLVTGGAGYLGCRLVPKLAAAGYRVIVFDKLLFGAEPLEKACGFPLNPGDDDTVTLEQGDVCNERALAAVFALGSIDHVIHLAGLSNDPTANYRPEATKAVNIGGMNNVLHAAVDAGVKRFLLASSCSVYYTRTAPGEITPLLNEADEVRPEAAYSASKVANEEALRAIAAGSGPGARSFEAWFAFRMGTLWGQSERMRYDLVVNAFVKDLFACKGVTVFNGGSQWRPMLHVDDAAEAYVRALKVPAVSGVVERSGIYNLAQHNWRVLEMAHWVAYLFTRNMGDSHHGVRVEYDEAAAPPRSYRVDCAEFTSAFDWLPQQKIDAPAVYAMYVALTQLKERNDWQAGYPTPYNHPRFYNIRWMKLLLEMEERLQEMGKVLP